MTQVETKTAVFADRLGEAVERRGSQLVLGLDPVLDLLPVELQADAMAGAASRGDAVARFCRGLIDAAAPFCVAVKPQLAFFEALGSYGMRAFEETCGYARQAGLLVIADAKRGDIGSTARADVAARPPPRARGPRRAGGGPADRRRDHAQRVPRPGVGGAVPRRLQARGRGHLRRHEDV